MRKLFYLITTCYILLATCYKTAFAQATPQYITVTPSIINLDFATDPAQTTITYTNNTSDTVALHLSAADFEPLEDGYKLQFLEGKNAKNYKYSLSSWIHFENNTITLSPHESKTVTIFIDKDKLTTGGHYGTIQAEWIRGKDQSPIPTNLILSSLIFVRTSHGNETEEAHITEFQPLQDWYLFPDTFVVKLNNTGNVELNPHGLIEITDMFHTVVAQGIINEGSLLTLPESIRRYDTSIKQQQSYIPPGFYHAAIDIHFGKKNIHIKQSMVFFSQGNTNLIPYAIGGLLLFFFLGKLLVKSLQKRYMH